VVDEKMDLKNEKKDKADDSYNDMLESELGGEVENGRLVRLMIKLGFINERAE
jgi:PAB-dependent poly(A)-specific ribonuclease subunit 3